MSMQSESLVAPSPPLLMSSESEMEVDEEASLLGNASSKGGGSWCRCWKARGCHRVWRVVTPSVLKTVAMVLVFAAAVVLFTRFPEAEEGAFMYAVSREAPLALPLGPAAALEATLWVQRATAAQEALVGVEVRLQVDSGTVCPANASAACAVTLRVQVSGRRWCRFF